MLLHCQYLKEMEEADLAKSWLWLRKGDLKGCTKALICVLTTSII